MTLRRAPIAFAIACLAVVGLGFGVLVAEPSAAVGNKGDGLSGRWSWIGFEQAGIAAGADQLKGWAMTVKKGRLALEGPSRAKIEADFTLDPSSKPKGIDLIFFSNQNRGKGVFGIYDVNNETLRICVPPAGSKARPRDFTATSANGCTLYVFSRKKI